MLGPCHPQEQNKGALSGRRTGGKYPKMPALLVPGCLFFSSVFSRCSVAVCVSLLQQTGAQKRTQSCSPEGTPRVEARHRLGLRRRLVGEAQRARGQLCPGTSRSQGKKTGAQRVRAWPTSRSPGGRSVGALRGLGRAGQAGTTPSLRPDVLLTGPPALAAQLSTDP